jgi:hypothetical protein
MINRQESQQQDLSATWRKSSYSGSTVNCVECTSATWHKSTHSGGDGNCLEAAPLSTSVAVRDSKAPEAGHLAFPGPEWAAFLAAVKQREL